MRGDPGMFKGAGRRRLGPGLLFPAACLILLLQAAGSRMVAIPERDLPIPQLHKLPLALGSWRSPGDQDLEESVAKYLKPDDYILRWYGEQHTGATLSLFVAHFKSLQNTYGPHSPHVCLPGAGWLVQSSQQLALPVPGRTDGIPVNEYLLEKSGERILVLYWYQNDRDIWADEFYAKLRLLPDLLRYRRSDVSLVRLIMPMRNTDPGDERAKSREFAGLLFPLLVERFAGASQ